MTNFQVLRRNKRTEKLQKIAFEVAKKLADDLGIAEKGFRLTINTGEDGGQAVKHLHMHLMGGRGFGWPPG